MKISCWRSAPEAMLVLCLSRNTGAPSGASSENLSCSTPRVENHGLGCPPQIPGLGRRLGNAIWRLTLVIGQQHRPLALVSESAGSTATDMCRVRALAVRPGSGRFASSWLLVGIQKRLLAGPSHPIVRPGTGSPFIDSLLPKPESGLPTM